MNIVIENALILPLTSEDAFFQGDICINGSTIQYLGPSAPESCYPAQVIDGTGFAVLPSFVNAHTHLSMVLMRNFKDSESDLFGWLSQIFPLEDKLTESDIYNASLLGLAEQIKSGITTFADMYFYQSQTARACVETGVKANIGFTFFGDLDNSKARMKERWPSLQPFLTDYPELIKVDSAPHAIYTTNVASYHYAMDFAKEISGRLHTHLSETAKEVSDSISSFGTTPAMYLDKLGFFDQVPTYLAHGVHITDQEISMLRDKNTSIVHNPSSNCKLASGIAPIGKFRENSLNVAMGTDGASSNNNLNMLKEINLACMIASVSSGNTLSLRPFDALRMATINGAKALGRDKECGTLEEGKKADLIMVNLNTVPTTPINNIYSALVYSCTSENIDTVLCNGEILMQNRKLKTINERKVRQQAIRCWNDLLSR